jgi:hypothetical protein
MTATPKPRRSLSKDQLAAIVSAVERERNGLKPGTARTRPSLPRLRFLENSIEGGASKESPHG